MSKNKVVHAINFTKPPSKGVVFLLDGQRFEVIRTENYISKSGMPSAMIVWRGCCAECGCAFEVSTRLNAKLSINRRCDEHKAKGRPVARSSRMKLYHIIRKKKGRSKRRFAC